MGLSLPQIDFSSDPAQRIVLGDAMSCVTTRSGVVKCWGQNAVGELGVGHLRPVGDEPGEMGRALEPVQISPGLPVRTLSCAAAHCCVTFLTNTVQCWGQNNAGELGLEDTRNRGAMPQDLGENLPFVALGDLAGAVRTAVGYDHSCAILVDGHVKCWGRNVFGQLGLGNDRSHGDVPSTMGESLPDAMIE
jgi:alpha-tubulin suppressor-like RCC1 family protein